MPNTTNFNWATPADTDLVKDGAAAIRTLGNSIDTSLVDLKGGTTGQVLSKTSNTDMDFTWTAGGDITEVQAGVGISVASGTGPIPVITNSSTDLITTAGDLLYGTAADTVARLGIGTAGQVLKVNSGATAPEWGAAAAGGGLTELASGTLSGNSIELTSISSSYKKLILTLSKYYLDSRGNIQLTVNSDTSSIYAQTGVTSTSDGSAQTPSATAAQGWSSAYDWIGNGANVFTGSTMRNYAEIEFLNYLDTSAYKVWRATVYQQDNTSTFRQNLSTTVYRSTSAISTIKVKAETTRNFSGGTYKLWGLN